VPGGIHSGSHPLIGRRNFLKHVVLGSAGLAISQDVWAKSWGGADSGAGSNTVIFAPANRATGLSIDQPLRMIFPAPPSLGGKGVFRIHDAADNSVVLSIDIAQFQSYTVDQEVLRNASTQVVQGLNYYYFPISILGHVATVNLSTSQRLAHNKTYYVIMDEGLFVLPGNQAVPAIADAGTWRFSTGNPTLSAPKANSGPQVIRVAPEGVGDFATLQGALDWIPQNNVLPRTVLIAPGLYYEAAHLGQNRRFVTIKGDSPNRTDVTIYHPAPATVNNRSAGVLRIDCDDVTVSNLTLDAGISTAQPNPAGSKYPDIPMFPGRVNVLYTNGRRLVFHHVFIKGGQDTLYTNDGVAYFKQCEIWGTTDFIYGRSLHVFDDCDIVELNQTGGAIMAPSTNADQPYGLVFLHCRLPRALKANGYPHDVAVDSTTLMRPWGKDGATAFIACKMGDHIRAKGWSEWDGREATCRAREFGSVSFNARPQPNAVQRQMAGAYWLNTEAIDYHPSSNKDTSASAITAQSPRRHVNVDPNDYTLDAIFGNPYFKLDGWWPSI